MGKMVLPFKLGLGGSLGSRRQSMSWIALDDIVRLIAWLIEHANMQGAFNGTAPTLCAMRTLRVGWRECFIDRRFCEHQVSR